MSTDNQSPPSQKETNKPDAKTLRPETETTSPAMKDSTTTNKPETDEDSNGDADPCRKKTSFWKCKKLVDHLFQRKGKIPKSNSPATGPGEKESPNEQQSQHGKRLLPDSIKEHLDYIASRAEEFGRYREQLHLIHKEASKALEDLKGREEEKGLVQLLKDIMKLNVHGLPKYESVDLHKNWRPKAKQSIFSEVPDMTPQLLDVLEISMEFKDFEARYNDLDDWLKLCLLCFSVFPENAIIKKRLMVQWWIAEGFATEANVNKYFDQLIDKGFIEPVNKNRSQPAGRCQMHPFNRSALIMLAKRAKFFNFGGRGEPTQNFAESYQACLMGNGLISYEDFKGGKLTVDDLEKLGLLKGNKLTVGDLEKLGLLKGNKLTVDDLKKRGLLKGNKLTIDDLVKLGQLKGNKLTVDDLEKRLKENNLTVDHLDKKLKENELTVDDLEKLGLLKGKRLTVDDLEKLGLLKGNRLTVDDLVELGQLKGNKLTVDDLEKRLKENNLTVDHLDKKLKENELTVDDLEKLGLLKGNKLTVDDLKKLGLLKGNRLTVDDLVKLGQLMGNNLTVDDLEKKLKENKLTVDDLDKKLKKNKLTGDDLENLLKGNKLTKDDLEKKLKGNKLTIDDLEKKLKENKLTVYDLVENLKANNFAVDHLDLYERLKENKLIVDDLEKKLKRNKLIDDFEKKLEENKLAVDDLVKKLKENKLPIEDSKDLHQQKGDKSTVDDLNKKLEGHYKLTVDDLEKLHLVINVDEHILEFKPDWFSKMTNLNFLHLGRWNVETTDSIEVEDTEFLNGLKNMRCLKFLSLQGVSNVVDLPDSIFKCAKHLNFLDLRACYNLDTIPETIGFLKNLTHLDMSECPLLDHTPKSLASLKNLTVLKGFVVGPDEDKENKKEKICTLDDLKKLKKLIKLCIYPRLKEFPEEKHVSALGELELLLKLTINWGVSASRENKTDEQSENGNRTDMSTAEDTTPREQESQGSSDSSMGRLPPNLEKLDLKCFPMSTTPEWLALNKLKNLKKLYITGGKLSDLGQYHDVGIDDFNIVWPVKNETWKVEVLRLKYLNDVEMEWGQLQELFPDLVYLEKVNCPKLNLFPCDANGVWTKKEKS